MFQKSEEELLGGAMALPVEWGRVGPLQDPSSPMWLVQVQR